jgi:Protein of unknown function (DUF4238)
MARHHYVPQFLLREWATNGRLTAYYFETASGKVIENAKAAVASACQIPDLNSYFGVHLSQRDFPETGFFTPCVDACGRRSAGYAKQGRSRAQARATGGLGAAPRLPALV